MKLKRRNKAKPEFNTSAMTDIVFLLLIFFIINYEMPNAIKLLLPNATGKTTANKSITLAVSSELRYSVNNKENQKVILEMFSNKGYKLVGDGKKQLNSKFFLFKKK